MLRPIKSQVRRPRLLGFSATTAASAANTVQVGSMEGTFTNAVQDYQLDIVLRKPFARAPIVVVGAGADISDGGAAFPNPAATVSTISLNGISGGASAEVGGLEALALGYEVADTTVYSGSLKSGLRSSFRAPVIIEGQVAADGTKNIGGSTFTSVKNSTGNYTITFTRAFGRLPTVVPTTFTRNGAAHVKSKTNNSVTIQTYNAADSAADIKFNFVAYGSSSGHEVSLDQGGLIEVGFRKPRIIGLKVTYSSGVPSIAIGTGLASVADTGTGIATLTYTEAFAREPIIIAGPETGNVRWVSLASSTSTGVALEFSNASGTLADPANAAGANVIIIGSDDAAEY